jgi:serine-type D-Ala-D-Ala carboxypeptidase (penicillin-binding protein 5/6)
MARRAAAFARLKTYAHACALACGAVALVFLLFDHARAAGPDELTGAEHVLLVDLDADSVLFAKQADGRLQPASLTKLMTAFVARRSLSTISCKA